MRNWGLLVGIIVLAVAIVGGCLLAYRTQGYRLEAPRVVGRAPVEMQDLPPETKLSVTFDRPMDEDSVERAFTIYPSIAGSFSWDDNTVTFVPTGDGFSRQTTYEVRLGTEARSFFFRNLEEPITFSFTTAGYLEVVNVQPAPDTEGTTMDSTIIVQFSRPVVPLTAMDDEELPQPLTLSPQVEGSGKWLNTSIYVFQPHEGMAPSTKYEASVKAGLMDVTGAILAKDYSWSFVTESPLVVSTTPEDESVYVGLTSPITVTFSQPMSRSSVKDHFSCQPEGSDDAVAGRFVWSQGNTVLTFAPTAELARDTTYVARLGQGALAEDSPYGLEEDHKWRFTTVGSLQVLDSTPQDGAEAAQPRGWMEIKFSNPMNTDGLLDNLTIIPEPTQVYSYWYDFDTSVQLNADFLASTSYEVTLGPDLEDRFGQKLGKYETISFTFDQLPPSVHLHDVGRIGTYNAYTPTVAYVSYRNVDRIDYALYSLDQGEAIRLISNWEEWRDFQPRSSTLIRHWSQEVSAPLNMTGVVGTALVPEGEGLLPGLYYLEVSSPLVEGSRGREIMVVSRFNLMVKTTATEALVWACDLATGEVVQGLPLELYDESGELLASGRTEKDGTLQVSFPQREAYRALYVFGGDGDQQAACSSYWDSGISPWEFDLRSQLESDPYAIYLYMDRDIYRPNQVVRFKGIVRADDDAAYSMPSRGMKVPISVRDAQDKEIYSDELRLNHMGTFNGEFALGEEASLGHYYVSGQVDDQYYGTSFQVAEYRKPEFQVSVTSDLDQYYQGEDISVQGEAEYYFGGPLEDSEVTWRAMTEDYFFRWKGEGYYDFVDYDLVEAWEPGRDWQWAEFGELLTEGETETDSEGHFTFQAMADIQDRPLSQRFTLEASVTDINNQEVSARTSVLVHKGHFYVGLRPQNYVGTVDESQTVEVVTVDPDSMPVATVPLSATVYRREYYSVQEKREDGNFYWTTKYEDTPVVSQTLTTDERGEASFTFVPSEGGLYRAVAQGADEGNLIRSATSVWVSGREYVNWGQDNDNRIELVSDSKEYEVGDVAEILVPSPYSGTVEALVTLERGHIMSSQVVTLQGNSEVIEVPIESGHVPNVYVSVVLFKGQDEAASMPSFKVGYVKLPVSTAEKALTIQIEADQEVYEPRDQVTYSVSTTDSDGRGVPAELSFNLVDLSVLALTGDSGQSILERFYSERGVGVATGATLAKSLDQANLGIAPEGKGGGGGGEGEGAVRRFFPDTAYWNPVVETNDAGQGQVEVELPDNLTTWRLDAKGVTADTLVGEATLDVVSTKELLVRPVTPRFFVMGDEARLEAIVHNNSPKELDVEISLEAAGALVTGETERTLQVPAGGREKVTWSAVVEKEDEVKLTFSARGGELSDAVELALPAYHFSTPETVATSGQVEDIVLETIRLPATVDAELGELTVQVEPSLAVGMLDGLKYLEAYPYGCTEQTVSRFLPNVMAFRALQELRVQNRELEANLPQQVGVGLQRLYKLQHFDGGWGWWLSDASDPYITAYVLLGMNEAYRSGFSVDEYTMTRASEFLIEFLDRGTDVESPHSLDARAFIIYVLAESGYGDLGRASALYQRREALQNYGKAYLAMSLRLLANEGDARAGNLVNSLSSSAITSATGAHWEEDQVDYWTMNTNTRSTAIVLDALVRLDPENPLIPNAVRWLMTARREGHWETTQETAISLIALTDYLVASGDLLADYSYQVSLNGREMEGDTVSAENLADPKLLVVEIADLLLDADNEVGILRKVRGDQTGKGNLWYSMYLHYFLPVDEVRSVSQGVTVAKEYFLMGKEDRRVTGAQVGDVIQAKITIIAPHDLHYLVVEDPLPAGCEALDASLKTTSVMVQRPRLNRQDEDRGSRTWYFSETALRDEKAVLFATYLPQGVYEYTYLIRAGVAGRFHVMPAHAYEMYFPEVYGRSDGSVFTIE